MTSVKAAGAVALFIRQQGIGRRQSEGAENHVRDKAPEKKDLASTRRDVASLVFKRIKFIEPTDPDRRRKAFRIFIESVLLLELGDELINDPKFYELVAEVEHRMRGEAALTQSIEDAAEILLKAPNIAASR